MPLPLIEVLSTLIWAPASASIPVFEFPEKTDRLIVTLLLVPTAVPNRLLMEDSYRYRWC